MRLGIAKIDQETIPEQLGDMSIKTCDHLGTDLLIRPDDFSILFGIKSARESGGIDQVAEHHRELAPFGFGGMRGSRKRFNLRGWLFLGSRRLCWLHRGRGCGRKICSVPSPHEYSAIFIRG